MSYFSIAAPQTVVLPDGTQLHFRINPQNSALVEIHMDGETADGDTGKHVLTFNRNGGAAGNEFIPVEKPKDDSAQRLADYEASAGYPTATGEPKSREPLVAEDGDVKPLADYKSVDDDPVRGNVTTSKLKPETA